MVLSPAALAMLEMILVLMRGMLAAYCIDLQQPAAGPRHAAIEF